MGVGVKVGSVNVHEYGRVCKQVIICCSLVFISLKPKWQSDKRTNWQIDNQTDSMLSVSIAGYQMTDMQLNGTMEKI